MSPHPTADAIGALVHEAVALQRDGQSDAAMDRALQAADAARAELGTDHEIFRKAVGVAAGLFYESYDTVSSRALYEWLVRSADEAGDPRLFATGNLSNLAHSLLREGHVDSALVLFHDALRALRRDPSPLGIETLHGVASALSDIGYHEEAAGHYTTVVELRREVLGPEHPELGVALGNLAYCRRCLGDLAASEGHYAEALGILRVSLADTDPRTSLIMAGKAEIDHATGSFEEAAAAYRRLIELSRLRGTSNPDQVRYLQEQIAACERREPLDLQPCPTIDETHDPFEPLKTQFSKSAGESYEHCIRSFLARDYAHGVEAALEHCLEAANYDIVLLLLVMTERLGLDSFHSAVAAWAVTVSQGTPYQVFLEYTVGRTPAAKAQQVADAVGLERGFAWCRASRLSTAGDTAAAIELFDGIQADRPRSLEGILSRSERLMIGVPADDAARPSRRQLKAFNAHLTALTG